MGQEYCITIRSCYIVVLAVNWYTHVMSHRVRRRVVHGYHKTIFLRGLANTHVCQQACRKLQIDFSFWVFLQKISTTVFLLRRQKYFQYWPNDGTGWDFSFFDGLCEQPGIVLCNSLLLSTCDSVMMLHDSHDLAQIIDRAFSIFSQDSGKTCQLLGGLKNVVSESFESLGCGSRGEVPSPERVCFWRVGKKVVSLLCQL